ncbi:MAG: hypothetical protein M5U23_13065 [Acidimicrobiia bacterium]|nr:hypothetical protein [Acidimicrobiia bacterium]
MEWVRLGHVVFAAIWFGGAVYVEGLMASVKRTKDPQIAGIVGKRIGATNLRLFGVSGILTLVFGIWLVLYDGSQSRWEFSDMFVSVGFLVVIVVLGLGIFYIVPQGKKIDQIIAERGPTDPEIKAHSDRIAMALHLSTLLLFIAMVVMVVH